MSTGRWRTSSGQLKSCWGDYKIEHATRHEHEVLAGHFGIGVVARDEEDRHQARQILKAHTDTSSTSMADGRRNTWTRDAPIPRGYRTFAMNLISIN